MEARGTRLPFMGDGYYGRGRAGAAHRDGLTISTAARRMDCRAYSAQYPQLADPTDTYDRLEGGLKRVYDQLEGRAAK